MKRTLACFLFLSSFTVPLLAAAPASADDLAPVAPKVDPLPAPTAEAPSSTQRNLGIGLTVGGSIGVVGGGVGIFATQLADAFSCDSQCPRPVSKGAQAAVIGATAVMGGALVTGILLLATSPSRQVASSRVRPTAGGVAFSF